MAKVKEEEKKVLSKPLPKNLKDDTKKIMFFALPSYRHVYPYLEISKALVQEGYFVRFYSCKEFQKLIAATGADFFELDDYLPYQYEDLLERIDRDFGILVEMTFDMTVKMEEMIKEEMAEFQPDLIMADHMCYWGKLFASRFKKPFIDLVPGFASNNYTESLKKIDIGSLVTLQFEMPRITTKVQLLQSFKYAIRGYTSLNQTNEFTKTIVLTSEEFQPRADTFKKDMISFVGPCISAKKNRPRKDRRKRILIEMNLSEMTRDKFYKSIYQSFGGKDVQVILSVPGSFSMEKYGELPVNFRICRNLDPADILPDCDAYFCTGGVAQLNTSMYFGVPVIVYPKMDDEKLAAYQVKEAGVGRSIKKIKKELMEEAIWDVLNHSSYREKAEEIRLQMQAGSGSNGVLKFVEAILKEKKGYLLVI